MPRPVAWLLLILAISGPLLTQEEAAEGLERFLIESGDRCEIEPPEGGIDEVPVEVSAWKVGPAVDAGRLAAIAPDALASPFPAIPFDRRTCPGRNDRRGLSWPPPMKVPRHAWLQRFLI